MKNTMLQWLQTVAPGDFTHPGAPRRVEFLPREDIVELQAVSASLRIVADGMACRYKLSGNGKRAILGHLFAGDICNLQAAVLKKNHHPVMALTVCKVVEIPRAEIESILQERPDIALIMMASLARDQLIAQEWHLNIGRRSSDKQLAHLFCELRKRMEMAGMASGSEFHLPLTQEELGETLGISTVHVNRVFQSLRRQSLLRLEGKHIYIPDLDRLEAFAEFDSGYLDELFAPRPERGQGRRAQH